MSIDDKLTDKQAPIPALTQPQDREANDKRPVVFSIGPSPLPPPAGNAGTLRTNADQPMDNDLCVQPKVATVFPTNADIPREIMGPPFSAPPTPAHRNAHTVGKQLSSPLFSNVNVIPEGLDESQHIYSQFSEVGPPRDEYQSQISYVDLPADIYPVQHKVSMEDEAIMQRQQQRFKMIEEQNKAKTPQFKQTYSDPYSYKNTDRVQAKQRRQGWYLTLQHTVWSIPSKQSNHH